MHDPKDDVERDELLISRVVDNDATTADWAELELLAQRDADVWRRLAGAIKSEAVVRVVLAQEVSVADGVDLPLEEPIPAPLSPVSKSLVARWNSAVGWAAAILFAVLWIVGVGQQSKLASNPVAPGHNDMPAELSADDALIQYFDAGMREGRLVGELPRLVVETRPLPDQEAVEIVYLRRLLERRTVDEFYDIDHTETGMPVATPVTFDHVSRRGSL